MAKFLGGQSREQRAIRYIYPLLEAIFTFFGLVSLACRMLPNHSSQLLLDAVGHLFQDGGAEGGYLLVDSGAVGGGKVEEGVHLVWLR